MAIDGDVIELMNNVRARVRGLVAVATTEGGEDI